MSSNTNPGTGNNDATPLGGNKKGRALGLLIFCNALWGLDYVNVEYLVSCFPPQFVNLGRTLICAAIVWTMAFVTKGGIHIAKKDWPLVLICGAFGTTIFGTLEGFSIQLIGSALAALILATVPIMGMVADRVLYKKPITLPKVLAILISIVGVALLILGGTHESLHAGLFGIVLMFITAACWMIYILLIKPVNEKYDMVTAISGFYVGGLVTCIPVALTGLPTMDQFKFMPLFMMVVSAAICINLGNFLYVYAVKHLSVTTISAFENVLPVVTCIGAYIFFGELLAGWQILGGIIIIAAVSWVSWLEAKEGKDEAA